MCLQNAAIYFLYNSLKLNLLVIKVSDLINKVTGHQIVLAFCFVSEVKARLDGLSVQLVLPSWFSVCVFFPSSLFSA